MSQSAIGYIASAGHNTEEDLKLTPLSATSASTKGHVAFLEANGGAVAGGVSISDSLVVSPIYKVFMNTMDECPHDKRRLTLEEATAIKSGLFPLMAEWDIIKVAGGKLSGHGYGNTVEAGFFDEGFGWVFLVNAGFNFYEKIFINSLSDIPKGWRRATIEECRTGPQADKIRSNLGQWDIIKVAGGKFNGPGYGSTLEPGHFDEGVGWVILVSE